MTRKMKNQPTWHGTKWGVVVSLGGKERRLRFNTYCEALNFRRSQEAKPIAPYYRDKYHMKDM